MIFVVLGTQNFQLNRLLKEIDELIEGGEFQFYRYIDKKQFDEYIEQATVVISHSGVRSIVTH